MGRRKMETGDVVVVDARGVRAFGIVEEISGDAEKNRWPGECLPRQVGV